jgi:DNA-binding IclR family transcriptional regulator
VTPGFASVAAAVHDHSGHPVAGAALTFPIETADAEARERLALRVTRAAGELSRRIGGRPPGARS